MEAHSDMAIFVAVIDSGGFSPAARRLGMTHSAVSKRVRRLEDRLRIQLLLRTTRSMSLTEAGQKYLREARSILHGIEALEAGMALGADVPRGTLKISASNAFGRLQVVPAIVDFMRIYPDLHIDLSLTDAVIDIGYERVDVAIRSAILKDSSLIARKLASNDRIICVAPAYLETRGVPTKPSDLAAHLCLGLNFQSRFNDWEFRGGRKVRMDGRFTCNSVEALHAACLAGVGIARLPEFMVGSDLAEGRLISLLNDARLPSESAIYAVRPDADFVPMKTRSFIDFLVDRFSPTPPWRTGAGRD
ncbi:LysR family transcriptional regulator [Mesorhizobium sp. CC13]|uniref:LysR family transcriptional regulator n=1 Tax=Mesorhizobium sp. CC13 TaxID=3029194 RepID=UPI00326724B5